MPGPILTDRLLLAEVPVLHVRTRELECPAPAVIWYHGWGTRKEDHLITAESLAVEGMHVLLPDAVRHGERDPFHDYDAFEALVHFWAIVEATATEAGEIARAAIAQGIAAPGRIGAAGNSMGGMVAAGALATSRELSAAVLCNSCPSLAWLADRFRANRGFPLMSEEERAAFRSFDPEAMLDVVAPRPILMLHGDADTSIPIEGVRRFYDIARPFYAQQPDHLALTEMPRLNHHVTVEQVAAVRSWFKRHL